MIDCGKLLTKVKVDVADGLDKLKLFKELKDGQKQSIRDTFNRIAPILAKIRIGIRFV